MTYDLSLTYDLSSAPEEEDILIVLYIVLFCALSNLLSYELKFHGLITGDWTLNHQSKFHPGLLKVTADH